MGVKEHVVILHNHVAEDASLDEADTLFQVGAVREVLAELGFRASTLPFSLDLGKVRNELQKRAPSFVFNLVESVEGRGDLIYLAPALLDHLSIKYTGCPSDAVYLTTNKITAKRLMRSARLPTPEWFIRGRWLPGFNSAARYIIKPVTEDASIGLDDASVASFKSAENLETVLDTKKSSEGRDYFAEQFIDGREFNISIIGNNGAPEILPPAEMRFDGYQERGKVKIVGYKSKWDQHSFEYLNTAGTFDYGCDDEMLITKLKKLSEDCWGLFSLRGYARVDVRVDGNNMPWILEVNANPCITPSASGFLNAAGKAGLDFRNVVERIIAEI